jgi:hypothetical protein
MQRRHETKFLARRLIWLSRGRHRKRSAASAALVAIFLLRNGTPEHISLSANGECELLRKTHVGDASPRTTASISALMSLAAAAT